MNRALRVDALSANVSLVSTLLIAVLEAHKSPVLFKRLTPAMIIAAKSGVPAHCTQQSMTPEQAGIQRQRTEAPSRLTMIVYMIALNLNT